MRRLALVALVFAGCLDESKDEQPKTITDQSGAVYDWECDADSCAIKQRDGSPDLPHCNPPSHPLFGYAWSVYITVTPACGDGEGWGGVGGWERFLVCESDADCPTIISKTDVDDFVCNAGYCKNVEHAESFDELPTRVAMILMCFGDVPIYEPFADPALMAAIEAACPGESLQSPCLAVPDGCPDPRG